jgi:hypothetical protein
MLAHPMPVKSVVICQNAHTSLNRNGSVRHCTRERNKYLVGVEFTDELIWLLFPLIADGLCCTAALNTQFNLHLPPPQV